MKSRGSALLRVTAGFVAGSAVGWIAHDRCRTFDSLLGRTADSHTEDYGVGRVWSFNETANFKPSISWDKNWDMWVAVVSVY